MSIYNYTAKNSKGENVSLSAYKGKVVSRFSPTTTPDAIESKIKALL